MAVIYFIRHGQASFGQEEYDRLSRIGERQAAILGRHFHRVIPAVDLMYSGGMRRQEQTAELARKSMGESPPGPESGLPSRETWPPRRSTGSEPVTTRSSSGEEPLRPMTRG